MIAIPDAVAFYWGDEVNRAAVDVLTVGSEVPGDLTLAEADRFELASLAAYRVRVEFRMLLRALWSASWDVAVRTHLPTARLLSTGGHRAFTAETDLADPSVDGIWANRAVVGAYELPGQGQLFTRLGLTDGQREAELQFYLIEMDRSCAITDGLELGDAWTDDGENRRTTRPGLLSLVRNEGRIAPEPLASLAGGALSALKAALP